MAPELIYRDDVSQVWLGDSKDPEVAGVIMSERKAQLLCLDAPYSARTHEGHAGGKLTADRAAGYGKSHSPRRAREAAYSRRKAAKGESGRRDIEYQFWSPSDVETFCDLWVPLTEGWCVSITDDILAPHWGSSFECNGLLRFAPLPLVETGSRVRMMGDGPSNWACWIVVARPRNTKFARWGALPGAYVQPGERLINSAGGSDRIVDSRPDDLVVDPTCGGGTTLVAAKMLGRRCIGVDNNRERAELSARMLADTKCQLSVFPESEAEIEQGSLFGEAR